MTFFCLLRVFSLVELLKIYLEAANKSSWLASNLIFQNCFNVTNSNSFLVFKKKIKEISKKII